MQQPIEQPQKLELVDSDIEAAGVGQDLTGDANLPPSHDLSWLWYLAAFGALLAVAGWLAMSYDPAVPLNSGEIRPGFLGECWLGKGIVVR